MRLRHLALCVMGVLILVFAVLPYSAHAQGANEPTGFKNVTLWIYPEYDDPRLLVMLEGKIIGASAPVQVRFLVPSTAEMFSAGSKDSQGDYTGGPPDRKASQTAGWDEISYQLKTDTFRVEYYDPIIIGQPEKSIAYDFRWLYPISDLEVIAQAPKSSTNYSIEPGGAPSNEDGFSVYISEYSNLNIDRSLHFEIKYFKSDPIPSLGLNSDQGSPSLSSSSGLQASNLILIIVIVFMGGLLIVGVYMFVLKPRLDNGYSQKYTERNAKSRKSGRQQNNNKFCDQCGNSTGISARFCPKCGNKFDN